MVVARGEAERHRVVLDSQTGEAVMSCDGTSAPLNSWSSFMACGWRCDSSSASKNHASRYSYVPRFSSSTPSTRSRMSAKILWTFVCS